MRSDFFLNIVAAFGSYRLGYLFGHEISVGIVATVMVDWCDVPGFLMIRAVTLTWQIGCHSG